MNTRTAKRRFLEVLTSFETAMLVTHDADGELRARPLVVLRTTDQGDVWFATHPETGKVDEIIDDARVAITMQSDERFLSLTGEAEIVTDAGSLHEMWADTLDTWFPDGADNDEVVLIRVVAHRGEFWEVGGTTPFEYLEEAVQHGPNREPLGGENASVELESPETSARPVDREPVPED